MKKTISIIILLILLLFTLSCGKDFIPVSDTEKIFAVVSDDMGNQVAFNKKPERIVVTSASFLEPLHAVGANVVGRPESKNKMPDWAKNIPSIGHVYQIDIERLLACNPDLVIVNKGMNEKIIDVLHENKISVLVLEMKTYEEVKHDLKIFSDLSGNTETGTKIIEKMDSDIQQIIEKIPKTKRRVAIIHSTAQGLSVQLDESIAGNIVKMLGWENVCSDMTSPTKKSDYADYSMEFLVEQNPEIIFVTSMGNFEEIKTTFSEYLNSNEAWQEVQAIQNGQIYYLPQDLFLLSPGLDYPKAVETIAKLVYPQIFQ